MTDLLQKLAKIFFIAGVVCLLVALHWLCFCLFTGSLNVAVFELAAFGVLLVFNAVLFSLLDDFL
jgi:hypothetical protein